VANPVNWFEIVGGSDPARLQSFYRDVFGWKIDASNPMQYGMVTAEEGGIGGGIGSAPEGSPGHVTVYVDVDDPATYLARVEQLGGKTITPPTEIPGFGVTFALFSDPEGHVVGLTKAGGGQQH
jgi:predicted enzyme related to lactoylglutathione lyase